MTSTVFITFAAPLRVHSRIVLFGVDDWIHRGVVKGEPWPVAAWIARVVVPRQALSLWLKALLSLWLKAYHSARGCSSPCG